MAETFLFDLDNTLVPTDQQYVSAAGEAANFIAQSLGLEENNPVIHRFYDILWRTDRDAVKRIGYQRDRWPRSVAAAYRAFCKEICVEPDAKVEGEIYRIGENVFNPGRIRRYGLIPGSRETLEFLKARGDALILVTLGDETFQKPKIEALEIGGYFDEIHIEPRNKPARYGQVADGLDREATFGVGDSFYDDAQPLLDMGFRFFLVKRGTSRRPERDELDRPLIVPERPGLMPIKTVADIPPLYGRIKDPRFWNKKPEENQEYIR